MDRRKVLVGIAALAMIADAAFIILRPDGQIANLMLVSFFGAAIFSMYPVIVAHANDHAAEGTGIQTSGGLLMVFGVGSIIGPLVAGIGMSSIGDSGLFLTSIAAHGCLIVFAIWRISIRAAVAGKHKGGFAISPQARASTPQTAVLAGEDFAPGEDTAS
jgi:MFS family permease